MTDLALSICIPTYNRARYLRCLLESLSHQSRALKCRYEILIADNASTDDTASAVSEFTGKLPIRYIKREKNYGPADNRMLLFRQAAGTIQLYVADDDDLILSEVDTVVRRMLDDPGISAVFAPWRLYDRVGKKFLSTFYSHADDVLIERERYEEMLDLILEYHIFPEICIIRSDAVRAAMPATPALTYWAFVHAAEYLALGKVAFRKEPFYISITRYFENEDRQQLGHTELQDAWDIYRGGVEYLLSRIPPGSLSPQKRADYLTSLQKFVAIRMQVAIRYRMHMARDPIDNYYLASRLQAMGHPALIPASFDEVRVHAAAHYVLTGNMASDAIDKVVCVGDIPAALYQALKLRAGKVPILATQQFSPEKYPHAVVIIPGSTRDANLDPIQLSGYHIRLVGADDLMRKFC